MTRHKLYGLPYQRYDLQSGNTNGLKHCHDYVKVRNEVKVCNFSKVYNYANVPNYTKVCYFTKDLNYYIVTVLYIPLLKILCNTLTS